jgi:hypothetical protein
MKHLIVLFMVAVLAVPAAANAAEPKRFAPCKADARKFCKDAKSKGVKVRDCLKEHKAEVTDACKTLLDSPRPNKGKGKGKKAPAAGTAAPSDAAPKTDTPPAQGETPPAQGETPPAQTETPPAQSETPPPAQQN